MHAVAQRTVKPSHSKQLHHVIAGLATGVVSMHSSFQAKDYRAFRASLFAGLGLTGIAPVLHSWALNYEVRAVHTALWLDFVMGLLYLVSLSPSKPAEQHTCSVCQQPKTSNGMYVCVGEALAHEIPSCSRDCHLAHFKSCAHTFSVEGLRRFMLPMLCMQRTLRLVPRFPNTACMHLSFRLASGCM